MQNFKKGGYNRKKFRKIKEIMNIRVGFVTDKPWQVVVGQQIGSFVNGDFLLDTTIEHSLANYLGEHLTNWLRPASLPIIIYG